MWGPLMRKTTADFVASKHFDKALLLAWQCRQLNDVPLADNLYASVIKSVPTGEEHLLVSLSTVEYLRQTSQIAQAGDLVQGLLKNEKYAKEAGLWRLAGQLAGQRGMTIDEISCLERAEDLEYTHLPEVIALEQWRGEHRKLLGHYLTLAQRAKELKTAPPEDLLVRTVRVADRWRAHDPDEGPAAEAAAAVFVPSARISWHGTTARPGLQSRRGMRVLSRVSDKGSRKKDCMNSPRMLTALPARQNPRIRKSYGAEHRTSARRERASRRRHCSDALLKVSGASPIAASMSECAGCWTR